MKILTLIYNRARRHPKISSAIFVAAFIFLLAPHFANAEWGIGQYMLNALISTFRILCVSALSIFAWVLGVTGILLDTVISFTVVKMSIVIDGGNLYGTPTVGIPSINTAWKFFRDIANMFFIFVLVYAGITTILGVQTQSWKVLLKNIVIAGLLINFSLFFTKIPIDVSNIIAIQFYKGIVGTSNLGGIPGVTQGIPSTGIAGEFMNQLQAQSVFSPDKLPNVQAEAVDVASQAAKLLLSTVFSILIFLIVTCVFLAIASMLVMRFLKLIYAMIISPFFFLGMILPQARKLGDEWKKTLFQQCIFPVVLFGLLFVIVLFLRSKALDVFTVGSGTFSDGLAATTAAAIGSMAKLLINYFLVIAMMVGALKAANDAGASGGKFAANMTNRVDKLATFPQRFAASTGRAAVKPIAATAGFAGRQTVGRFANKIANSTVAKKGSAQNFDEAKGTLNPFKIARGISAGASGMINRGIQAKVQNVGSNVSFVSGSKDGFTKRRDALESDEKKAKSALDEKDRQNKFQEAKGYHEYWAKADIEGKADTDEITVNGKTQTVARIKEIRKNYEDLLKKRRNPELDKFKFKDIESAYDLLTAKQAEYLTGKDSKLTDEEKDKLKKLRKEMFTEPLKRITELKKTVGPLSADETRELDKLSRKFTSSFNRATPEQVAKLGPEFFLNPTVIPLLEGKHIKKITDAAADGEIGPITDPEKSPTGTKIDEPLEHLTEEIIKLEIAGERNKAYNTITKGDIAGILGLDTDAVKARVAAGRRPPTPPPTPTPTPTP